MTALANLALGLTVLAVYLVVLGLAAAWILHRLAKLRRPGPDRPWQPQWQDEACAVTAAPVVRRPQPRISSAARRLGAEVETYLKENV